MYFAFDLTFTLDGNSTGITVFESSHRVPFTKDKYEWQFMAGFIPRRPLMLQFSTSTYRERYVNVQFWVLGLGFEFLVQRHACPDFDLDFREVNVTIGDVKVIMTEDKS